MAMNIAGFQSHPIPPIARSSNLLDSTRCSAQDGDDTHPDPTPQEILDSPGGKQFFTSSREGGFGLPMIVVVQSESAYSAPEYLPFKG